MNMKKNMLVSVLTALALGFAFSYVTYYFQAQRLYKLNKERIENNDKDRRQKICNDVKELQDFSSIATINIIRNEIDNLEERKIIRWQK